MNEVKNEERMDKNWKWEKGGIESRKIHKNDTIMHFHYMTTRSI